MKTAATVLQEMMVKLGENPQYECTAQSGPQHQCMFEYRVSAHGVLGVAAARSKKEARQQAARRALQELARRGHTVPPPYNHTDGVGVSGTSGAAAAEVLCADVSEPIEAARNAVALLRDLCEEYHLGDADYELVGDSGPPHLRHFTMRCSLRGVTRQATATTKKAARQLAAHQLYTYFKDNLHRLTGDIDESEALVRAHDRAMERYVETRDLGVRPQLTQCIADYHLGLKHAIGEEAVSSIVEALKTPVTDPVETLSALHAAYMPTLSLSAAPCVELTPTAPPLAFHGVSTRRAAHNALRYLQLTLEPW